jgi:hypothetical protein
VNERGDDDTHDDDDDDHDDDDKAGEKEKYLPHIMCA